MKKIESWEEDRFLTEYDHCNFQIDFNRDEDLIVNVHRNGADTATTIIIRRSET